MAGLGFGVGVGIGNADGNIGGGVAYALGQIDAMIPAELAAALITPIMLLYRMLLGSAFANMGAAASAAIFHEVAVVGLLESTIVGFV